MSNQQYTPEFKDEAVLQVTERITCTLVGECVLRSDRGPSVDSESQTRKRSHRGPRRIRRPSL